MLMSYTALIEEEADKLTFENIYYRYHKQMLEVAARFSDTREDAEDIVQEALLRLAKYIKQVPTDNRLKQKAYVLTVVKNLALRIQDEDTPPLQSLETASAAIPAGNDPLEAMLEKEDFDTLLRMLHALPIRCREVLLFRYVFDMPVSGIAAALDRKEKTVKQQLTRVKQLLAQIHAKQAV